MTPIGGLACNVGEEAIDRFILSRVRRGTRNTWLVLASALSTPGKSAANVARFRAPHYREPDLGTPGLTMWFARPAKPLERRFGLKIT